MSVFGVLCLEMTMLISEDTYGALRPWQSQLSSCLVAARFLLIEPSQASDNNYLVYA